MEHPFSKPRGGAITVLRDGAHVEADEASLFRTLTTAETDDDIVWAVEYRDGGKDGQLVHRSAHVHLKRGITLEVTTGNVGG